MGRHDHHQCKQVSAQYHNLRKFWLKIFRFVLSDENFYANSLPVLTHTVNVCRDGWIWPAIVHNVTESL